MISFTDRMSFIEEFEMLKHLRKERSPEQETRFKILQKEMRRVKDQEKYSNSTKEYKEKQKLSTRIIREKYTKKNMEARQEARAKSKLTLPNPSSDLYDSPTLVHRSLGPVSPAHTAVGPLGTPLQSLGDAGFQSGTGSTLLPEHSLATVLAQQGQDLTGLQICIQSSSPTVSSTIASQDPDLLPAGGGDVDEEDLEDLQTIIEDLDIPKHGEILQDLEACLMSSAWEGPPMEMTELVGPLGLESPSCLPSQPCPSPDLLGADMTLDMTASQSASCLEAQGFNQASSPESEMVDWRQLLLDLDF